MYTCQFCGYTSETSDDFEEDFLNHKGFWCPDCDSFTYNNKIKKRHSFKLILEDKVERETSQGTVKFKTNVSPLRYPGGKSRMVSLIYDKCNKENMQTFIEPYCGGASVGLSLLAAGVIKKLYLNDIDYGVYSLYLTILEHPEYLISRLHDKVPDREQFFSYRKYVLEGYKCDIEEAAWMYLVVNRMAFSGIVSANPMSDINARWNVETLVNRINQINSLRDQIYLSCIDACSLIEEAYWMPATTILIDPPYFKKGKVLYNHWYSEKEHTKLAALLQSCHAGFPGADILLTYDYDDFIDKLYKVPEKEIVGRRYSIAN